MMIDCFTAAFWRRGTPPSLGSRAEESERVEAMPVHVRPQREALDVQGSDIAGRKQHGHQFLRANHGARREAEMRVEAGRRLVPAGLEGHDRGACVEFAGL